jgi:pimeloyl-ACP methyl ester carboxylesterase
MTTQKKYTTDFVTSKDRTKIGHRQLRKGAGLILVHGGVMASQNFMSLAELLANEFTVYIPDRRGRGLSECGQTVECCKGPPTQRPKPLAASIMNDKTKTNNDILERLKTYLFIRTNLSDFNFCPQMAAMEISNR